MTTSTANPTSLCLEFASGTGCRGNAVGNFDALSSYLTQVVPSGGMPAEAVAWVHLETLEGLLDGDLPPEAYNSDNWWNTNALSECSQDLKQGEVAWETQDVDFLTLTVSFARRPRS